MFVFPYDVVGGARDEGLDEVDAEEAEEVDEGGDEGEDGGEFGEGDDVERGGGANLVAPVVEEVVGDGEEEGEEDGVGQVQREREGVGGLRGGGGGSLVMTAERDSDSAVVRTAVKVHYLGGEWRERKWRERK